MAGMLLGILPPFLLGWTWEETIYRALIFLVVASPCALMASIMPTLLSGIANGARRGILFKNGAQLEQIGRVRAIAFDKTGTLTTDHLQVVNVLASQIKQLGVEHVVMLTGDNPHTASSIAEQVGVAQVYAELLPEDKVEVIRKLQQQYQTVAMGVWAST